MDLQKATDTVRHRGLIYKLIINHVPEIIIKLLVISYWTNCTFQSNYYDTFSQTKVIGADVPQGSVLAPLLYNIYSFDIPYKSNTTLAIYADDTVIFCKNRNYNYAAIAM